MSGQERNKANGCTTDKELDRDRRRDGRSRNRSVRCDRVGRADRSYCATSPRRAAQLSWGDGGAAGRDELRRRPGPVVRQCPRIRHVGIAATQRRSDDPTRRASMCYRVIGHYGDRRGFEPYDHRSLYDTTPPLVPTLGRSAGRRAGLSVFGELVRSAGGRRGQHDGVPFVVAPGGFRRCLGIPPHRHAGTTRCARRDRRRRPRADDAIRSRSTTRARCAAEVHPFQSPTTGSPILLWTAGYGRDLPRCAHEFDRAWAEELPHAATSGWQDPDTLAPGTYTYIVTATDAAGNAGRHRRRLP